MKPCVDHLIEDLCDMNVTHDCVGADSLRLMNVAMVTVLKNVTDLITAVGEIYFFSKRHNSRVWVSLGLMAGLCVASLKLLLYSRLPVGIEKSYEHCKKKTTFGNLNEFSIVLLNNFLSLPLGLGLIFIFETQISLNTPALKNPMFWLVLTVSGMLGLAISFTSLIPHKIKWI